MKNITKIVELRNEAVEVHYSDGTVRDYCDRDEPTDSEIEVAMQVLRDAATIHIQIR
tara:strand:+ start:251 stop:421 length:171 start_codon:yes stop_codon:yes gene_type:complete